MPTSRLRLFVDHNSTSYLEECRDLIFVCQDGTMNDLTKTKRREKRYLTKTKLTKSVAKGQINLNLLHVNNSAKETKKVMKSVHSELSRWARERRSDLTCPVLRSKADQS